MVILSWQQQGLLDLTFFLLSLERIILWFLFEGIPLLPTTTPPFLPTQGSSGTSSVKKMISLVFPRLEKADSHGIPMEQRNGEIESTTKYYTNTHTHTSTHTQAQMCIGTAIQRNTGKPMVHPQLHSTFSGRWNK